MNELNRVKSCLRSRNSSLCCVISSTPNDAGGPGSEKRSGRCSTVRLLTRHWLIYLAVDVYLAHLPNGRNETGHKHNLSDWVRHHDNYNGVGSVDPTGRYVPAQG